ncbi:MAG: PadR family transcriptional regulator [Planctomycetaceae bacterium]
MDDNALDNWQVQIRKGLLELCILNSLRGDRLYGYEIVKQLREIEGLVIGDGTIYPILSRFRKQDLVESTIEESPDGPARKYYRLTPLGERCLTSMNKAWEDIVRGIEIIRRGENSHG